jgi:dihydroorotase
VSPTFDLVVEGGRVIDPAQGVDSHLDIGVVRGRIAQVGSDLAGPDHGGARQVVDAKGALVVPGLIDIHAHVFTGVCP